MEALHTREAKSFDKGNFDFFPLKDLKISGEDEIIYPESDGMPMAENTEQYEWIVKIKEGLEILTELDTRPDISIGHLYLGELCAEMNQDKEAQSHLKKAEALFKEMSMDYWVEEAGKIMARHTIGNP